MTTGQETASQQNGRRPVLLAAVLAVLFGILGMHALNNHGAMATPTSADAGHQMSSMSSMSAMAGAAADMAAATAGEQAAHLVAPVGAAVSNPAGGDHGPVGMLMLCLAMLVAAAIALAVVVRSGKPFRWLSRPRWSTSLSWSQTAVRGTGPPPSWEFSVIRC